MTRVLLLGLAPLPFENLQKMYGPGIRTWQFAKPLVEDGHEVCLIASRMPFVYSDDEPPIRRTVVDGVTIYTVSQPVFETTGFVQTILDDFQPDCVVGATIYPSYVAAKLQTERPLWIDLFGHVMAEAQAKAHIYGTDEYLYIFWNYEHTVLLRGDAFSAVSQPQKFATIGELGAYGRLNRYTFGHDLVHSIPCAIEGEAPPHDRIVFRGTDVADDDFVVLWSGGYNTWTDVDSLMSGLERAMTANPRIKFVSTGGQIDGHDELTYPRFLQLIARSPHANNFVMKGWVPSEDVPSYYHEANVGINIDSDNYEGMLGSRNRILSWLAAGLPVLTTDTTEISHVVQQEGLGHTFPHRDPAALADLLIRVSANQDELRAKGQQGQQYVLTHYTYRATALPLRRWVANPQPAPDRGQRVPLETRQQPNLLTLVPREIRQYYRSKGLRGAIGRVGSFVLPRLGQRIGPRLQPTLYLARYQVHDIPERMRPGETCHVNIGVVNQSTRTWSGSGPSSPQPISLSYRWYTDDGASAMGEASRSPLPADIEPGQALELQIEVHAPEIAGRYILAPDMVEGQSTWFGDIVPGSAPSVAVIVED
ncbi:MAG: glycosyltransferase [Chloroflexota bacterium]|nr:MAG: glycosyltransferase [Chloroflexota bacterium]